MFGRGLAVNRELWWGGAAMAVALAGLFALALDQGQLLSLVQGDVAYQLNVLHELVHDARHAMALPCH